MKIKMKKSALKIGGRKKTCVHTESYQRCPHGGVYEGDAPPPPIILLSIGVGGWGGCLLNFFSDNSLSKIMLS